VRKNFSLKKQQKNVNHKIDINESSGCCFLQGEKIILKNSKNIHPLESYLKSSSQFNEIPL
jgi:hypothetical protein